MTCARSALGDLARFWHHDSFTKVQERVIPSLLESDDNVVVAAPTGSGKTMLLEVAMLKLFRARLLQSNGRTVTRAQQRQFTEEEEQHEQSACKAVYICPIKALANEKYEHWRRMFAPLAVVIETGDQDHERQRSTSAGPELGGGGDVDDDSAEKLATVSTADIIITTPERWDSITRRWKERTVLTIVNSVGLLLLDEVHTVHEDRGAALEAVVSRMKAIKAQQQPQRHMGSTSSSSAVTEISRVRFVAISGTLPNIEDFAEWLHVRPSMVFSFSSQDRPVPLSIKVIGYASDSNNPFAFDRFLSFKLFGLIRQYSQGKPTIVFCASRKEATASAQRLIADVRAQAMRANGGRASGGDSDDSSGLEPSAAVLAMASTANDKQLRQCLLLGIAYHHAAMTANDRLLVERMFREQYVAAICTTTTLALGVNLPAHLVVVKGTTFFKSGKRDDVPLSEVVQMCGRAGRPGLDDHGVALVLTTNNKVVMYENLIHGDVFTTVESQLHRSMIEHVNAEVALRTIHSFASGVDWVRTTFFWIRLRRCPQKYGLKFTTKAEELSFQPESFAKRLMERVLTALYDEECVDVRSKADADGTLHCDADTSFSTSNREQCCATVTGPHSVVESTRIGRNMARMYILFDTVKVFNDEVRSRWRTASAAPLTGQEEGGDPDVTETIEGNGAGGGDGDGNGETAANNNTVENSDNRRLFAQGAEPLCLKRRFRLQDVLALCCRSAEFEEVGLRQGDKGPLNEMNKAVKFPVKSGHKGGREVRENWHKSFVLVQAQLGQIPVNEISLRNDSTRLWSVVPRVMRFLSEYARFTGSHSFYVCANLLLRCVEQRVWPDGLVLKQLDGVNETLARSLCRAGYRELKSLRIADPRKLEAVCGRLPPYGNQLRRQAEDIPQCSLRVELLSRDTRGGRRYRVSVQLLDDTKDGGQILSQYREADAGSSAAKRRRRSRQQQQHQQRTIRSFLLLAGLPQQDRVLLFRYISVDALYAARDAPAASTEESISGGGSVNFEFTVPACVTTAYLAAPKESTSSHNSATVEVAVVAEHWVGSDVTLVLPLAPGNDSDAPFSAHTMEAGHVAVSSRNEAGQLSNAVALRGSHSLLTTFFAKTEANDSKLTAASGTTSGTESKKGGISQSKRDKGTGATEQVKAAGAQTTVVDNTEKGQGEFAETAAAAHASFQDLLQDLQFISGHQRKPSQLARSAKKSRQEVKQLSPQEEGGGEGNDECPRPSISSDTPASPAAFPQRECVADAVGSVENGSRPCKRPRDAELGDDGDVSRAAAVTVVSGKGEENDMAVNATTAAISTGEQASEVLGTPPHAPNTYRRDNFGPLTPLTMTSSPFSPGLHLTGFGSERRSAAVAVASPATQPRQLVEPQQQEPQSTPVLPHQFIRLRRAASPEPSLTSNNNGSGPMVQGGYPPSAMMLDAGLSEYHGYYHYPCYPSPVTTSTPTHSHPYPPQNFPQFNPQFYDTSVGVQHAQPPAFPAAPYHYREQPQQPQPQQPQLQTQQRSGRFHFDVQTVPRANRPTPLESTTSLGPATYRSAYPGNGPSSMMVGLPAPFPQPFPQERMNPTHYQNCCRSVDPSDLGYATSSSPTRQFNGQTPFHSSHPLYPNPARGPLQSQACPRQPQQQTPDWGAQQYRPCVSSQLYNRTSTDTAPSPAQRVSVAQNSRYTYAMPQRQPPRTSSIQNSWW